MQAQQVIAIFDVGKTNKKLFLIDQHYRIVYERSARFLETADEDGHPCEDLESIQQAVFDSLQEVLRQKKVQIKAVNFATYGASFVYLGTDGKPVAPLYNYLKPYPENFREKFYASYGGEEKMCRDTASPSLGALNSGLQLYRIKYERPELFEKIQYALHLPQYLSYLLTGKPHTDMTSIGCHTALWDFSQNRYHHWVYEEGLAEKFPSIVPTDYVLPVTMAGHTFQVGIGLHDSSAALIPYLVNFQEPFVLISTGTWCISMNPFNHQPLTAEELKQDCLCYLQYQGMPVKSSRLFAGDEHEREVKRIAEHFLQDPIRYRTMEYQADIVAGLQRKNSRQTTSAPALPLQRSRFAARDLSSYGSDVEAYHQLMMDIMEQQQASTQLVLQKANTKRIFVDGGFGRNSIYMNLLACAFPQVEVYAASMPQATALGAALVIHEYWNNRPLPNDIIQLKYYSLTHSSIL